MKVMVLGSGGREHALVRALVADPQVDAVLAAPGNPGMDSLALCLPVPLEDHQAVLAAASKHAVSLVVVGPEAPLVEGLADVLREAGIACFGPSQAAAQLEGSKAFAKEVMAAAEVPTALAHVCATLDEVELALDALGAPYVVKDDGLAAGKGVVVTHERDAAIAHARACLERREHGAVLIEEYLDGPEVSLLCVCDGTNVVPLSAAQDFKRVFAGDEGPNTGGMGAYSPLEWAPPTLAQEVIDRVAQPVIREMARRQAPFSGVLYVGLALTSRGLKVIEFNVRFGDPETQVVLPRLLTPLSSLLIAAATGRLEQLPPLRWDERAAVAVVLAAPGYPGTVRTGDPISGLEQVESSQGQALTYVLHAGTANDDQGLVAAGGRVLAVVSLAEDLSRAREQAYAGMARIDLPGGHFRSDIALRASRGEIAV